MLLRRRAPIVRPAVCLLAVAALAAAPTALAQNYKSLPVENRLSSRGAIARNYIKRNVGDKQEFEDYIEKYFFPAMTQSSPEDLGDLEKLSGDLFKNFLYASNGATQKYLHDQATRFAVGVLRDAKFHPSVRYNALLILGKLDDKYPVGSEAPVPSADANKLLCQLAERAIGSARAPRYELVGSLVGLERHTRYFDKMPGEQKQKTAATLYKVLSSDNLPGEYAPGVRDWIYLQAATAVGNLGTAGPRGVFATSIAKRSADETLSLERRAAIAAQLDRLKLQDGQLKDAETAAAVVKAVTDLAAAVAEDEAKIAKKFEDMDGRGGMRVEGGRGKINRRVRETMDQGVELLREGLLAVLIDVRKSVQGVKTIADEASQPKVAAVEEALSDAIRTAGDKDEIDLNVTDAVKRMANRIESAVTPALAAAE